MGAALAEGAGSLVDFRLRVKRGDSVGEYFGV